MAQDDTELDYAYLAQNALRGVMRDVLEVTEALGAPPGDHHFYIEFLTGAPGVAISSRLREQYPDRMTIVLQHQFEKLSVHQERFEVTLHFKGIPDHLVIPFEAVTQFADPSADFALQFPVLVPTDGGPEPDEAPEPEAESEAEDAPKTSADVVSLDRFRKKDK